MKSRTLVRLAVLPLFFALGCAAADPLVPTAPAASQSAIDPFALKVTAPAAQAPANDVQLPRGDIVLSAAPAQSLFGASTAGLLYRFEVYNAANQRVAEALTGGSSWEVPVTLNGLERHTWRVRAESGAWASAWSTSAGFVTPIPRPCGPPYFFDPIGIISCHIAEFDHDLHGRLDEFLLEVAIDLNRAGVDGGPFGRLRKVAGNNCNGWSCDILCAEQGSRQRQYDILVDERFAVWGSPSSGGGIRVDHCEVPDYDD